MGDDDPQRGKDVRRQQAEDDEASAGRPQVLQLAGGRHTHLEQKQAQHALERQHEEPVVIGHDLLALQPAEQSDDDAAEEQAVAGRVLAAALAKYPFLDHESDAADADAIEDVIARRDLYMRQGMPFAKALAAAVEKVGPRYAPQDAPAKSTRTATTEQIKRNLERERRIPAAMPGVGERGKDIDYAALSEDEFDALSEQDKRKARGDFVKADA